MHVKEFELRSYHDQELSARDRARVAAHLASCASCRQTSRRLLERSGRVASLMAQLEPGAEEAVPTIAEARQGLSLRLQTTTESQSMLKKLVAPKFRIPLAAASLILLVVLLLFVPSIRAVAGDFLGLFRVQQIQVIEFDPANLPQSLDSHFVDFENLFSDQVNYGEPSDPQIVASPQEAAGLAGFPVRLPAAADSDSQIAYQPGTWISIDIDLDRFTLLLNEIGRSDLSLPDSLDGETITFNIPDSVMARFGDCALDDPSYEARPARQRSCSVLVQMPSPTIDAPVGLEIDEIGQTFLQILGMSATEAADFSARVDWATTLIIPVPEGADYQDVIVDGVDGTLLRDSAGPNRARYSIIWVKDGIVYALSGEGTLSEALDLANSLR